MLVPSDPDTPFLVAARDRSYSYRHRGLRVRLDELGRFTAGGRGRVWAVTTAYVAEHLPAWQLVGLRRAAPARAEESEADLYALGPKLVVITGPAGEVAADAAALRASDVGEAR